ncbi:MAG: acetylornithine deacetylase [Geminicoccaceae bacterium]|nr:MAG: acetylornithine deacetylase [Geminicoccaceae bacterium]
MDGRLGHRDHRDDPDRGTRPRQLSGPGAQAHRGQAVTLARTIDILARLVAFESVSFAPNLPLLAEVAAELGRHGVEPVLLPDATGERANLVATIGPAADGGVVLSGHTDVVPVTGQGWHRPPFRLTQEGNRLYGRGTTDMKGFLACCLAMVPHWQALDLRRPIHLAFSYDEEPGSLGAPALAAWLAAQPFGIAAVLVGEPTGMAVVAGHKGGVEFTTTVTGVACHSADPRRGVSALTYALRFIDVIERLGAELEAAPVAGSPFDPPFSTLHVGTLRAGTARNIVPDTAVLDWELRLHPSDTAAPHSSRLDGVRRALEAEMCGHHPGCRIETRIMAEYPGLALDPAAPAVRLAQQLSGAGALDVVPFGTDAGCFQRAGLSTVVIGPGSIERAHRPDEFVETQELEACLGFLARLGAYQQAS